MNQNAATIALARFMAPDAEQMRGAAAFMENYATTWASPNVDAAALGATLHPDTRMLIPPMTEPADREGVVAHFAGVLQRLPDLHLEVVRWAPTGDAVFVEWKATASIGGQPVAWMGVDRFILRDGLQIGGQAYWDTRLVEAKFADAIQAAQAAAAKAAP